MLFEEDVTQGSESKEKSYVLVEVALDQVERQMGEFQSQMGSFIHATVCVFRSRDSLYIHNAGCEFRYVTGKGTGYMQNKNSKHGKNQMRCRNKKNSARCPKNASFSLSSKSAHHLSFLINRPKGNRHPRLLYKSNIPAQQAQKQSNPTPRSSS